MPPPDDDPRCWPDVSFVVKVLGSGLAKVFTLSCTGANDGEDGPVTSFRLESLPLGTDADGNVTTAPVVVQVDGVKTDGSNLKGSTAKALDSLKLAIQEHGVCPPDGSPGFPDGVCTVSRDEWRDQFYADTKVKEPAILDAALRQRFTRASGQNTRPSLPTRPANSSVVAPQPQPTSSTCSPALGST
jgi:hypothetical protein